ncbi:MAG: glucosaminidase domain-containing protein [Rhodospirillaceae bacterium]
MVRNSLWGLAAAAAVALPVALALQLVPDGPLRGGRMVTVASVADAVDLFRRRGFDPQAVHGAGDIGIPPVFLAALPGDLGAGGDLDRRKAVFVSLVLPHVLHANDRIRADRERLEALRKAMQAGSDISRRDGRWLAAMAARHGTGADDFDELLRRVDIVAPKLAVAQAVQESGWGTSRFAHQGNALFGQHAPVGEDAIVAAGAPGVALKAFDSLHDSVVGYMHNLNTHRAYRDFRAARERMRAGGALDAFALAETLSGYSEEGRLYVQRLRAIMAQPEISVARSARLVRAAGTE